MLIPHFLQTAEIVLAPGETFIAIGRVTLMGSTTKFRYPRWHATLRRVIHIAADSVSAKPHEETRFNVRMGAEEHCASLSASEVPSRKRAIKRSATETLGDWGAAPYLQGIARYIILHQLTIVAKGSA